MPDIQRSIPQGQPRCRNTVVEALQRGPDGQLDQADLAKARSFGIRGLHERASTVGGWVELSSRGGGTSLILSVPLQPGAAAAVRPGETAAEPAVELDADGWPRHEASVWGSR